MLRSLKTIIYFSLVLTVIASCKQSTESEKTNRTIISGIDNSLKPGDNFFSYVNRIWWDSVKIPASQSGVGSYSFLNYPQRIRLQAILDSVSQADNAAGSIEQKVGDYYASGMDTATINKRGYEPVQPILSTIDAITDVPSMMKFVADQEKVGNSSVLGFYIGPDPRQSTVNIVQFAQTGIGLPDRDYYFEKDSSTLVIQNAYRTYLKTLFELTGVDNAAAAKNAATVYKIENQIAASHKTNVERRDVQANYNKLAVSALAKRQPNIGWATLLPALGLKVDSLNVEQPAYYDKLNALLKSIPLNDWKLYLKAGTLSTFDDVLSKPFADASFKYTKALTGQAVRKPRAEEITQEIDRSLGHALAQLYVKKYFTEDAKKRMRVLVDNLKKAFETRIDNLDWMSDSTKTKAKEKLSFFTEKIGYPDKWRDYTNVTVGKETYFENRLSANKNEYLYNIAKIGQPIDRTEWFTTPPTVTAYNNPPMNEIVFPAGILQPPYFDINADDALNYGGIGMVIGHEITHSFDDQGAQYDKDGNLKNWWTKDDYAKFKAKTQQVIDLYSTFTVLDSVHVKGALTVGENTADIAGVRIAYDAFKLTPQGQDTTKLDGFTPDQRFFISVARIWRVKTTDEFLRMYINTNNHSPAMWRVNGPLMNTPAFYKAFDVQPGDKMYKAESERITVW